MHNSIIIIEYLFQIQYYGMNGAKQMKKVYIDGSAGTTGLRILDRLSTRKDIDLFILDDEHRKDNDCRKEAINTADIVFLCLPDAAAIEAVSMLDNDNTVIIDTSTAHRTNPAFAYGFPELTGQREKIAKAKLIANPGCHASGFVSLIAPLTEKGVISKGAALSAFSLTGYSGGGKKMISDYEENPEKLLAPRIYGLTQMHKHLPEMKMYCNLDYEPIFSPIVSSYYSGMEVVVSLFKKDINCSIEDIKDVFKNYYTGSIIRYCDAADPDGMLGAAAYTGKDNMAVGVFGNEDRITLVSRFDNLGKGASGAAIQNMNIVLGVDETTGLNIGED